MIEEWRSIKGYKNYEASNLGRIKSLDRLVNSRGSGKRIVKGKILKPFFDNNGYLMVKPNGKPKRIHQLVAIAFLNHTPDGTHKIVVDHIDNDRLNNRVDNLQLISNRENSSKDRKGYFSKYVGVSWYKRDRKWVARIRVNGENKNLGHFTNEIEAAESYQTALKTL